MKVKDILPRKEKIEKELANLQKLERYFDTHKEEARELEKTIGCDMPLEHLITETRITYGGLLADINRRIGEAELKD